MITQTQQKNFDLYRETVKSQTEGRARLTKLFDDGQFSEFETFTSKNVLSATGFVRGFGVAAFSQDRSTSSQMNAAHADKICRTFDTAAKLGVPVVGFYDCDGALISEGAESVLNYGKILAKSASYSGVIPQIAVVDGVCSGTLAVIAASADFIIATAKSEIYTSPKSEKNSLTEIASVIVSDIDEAIEKVSKILEILPGNNINAVPEFEYITSGTQPGETAEKTALAFCDGDSVIELFPDYGNASYIALAQIGGSAVGYVATDKTAGKIVTKDCKKIARFVNFCDAFGLPIITLINSEGFCPNVSVRAMAKLTSSYSQATAPKINIFSGLAYGSLAAAFCASNADTVIAFPDAVIAPMLPDTAVEFLYHEKLRDIADPAAKRNELADTYKDENGALAAAEKGLVSEIIAPGDLRSALINILDILRSKRVFGLPGKKHSAV
ncbi:MAG: carboxyl transferase [Ruminococcus sp.]|jgi:acetyl-CoA carboxylase carboxyltransferase component|nr:carboxyl transferase [Ruminococcus sp.]